MNENEELYRHVSSTSPEEPDPMKRGRNVIAVVGIDDYQHWPKLKNAVSDAGDVRRLFQDLGFVELVSPLFNQEATYDAINELIVDQLKNQLEKDDSLVFFFAGHGHSEKTTVAGADIPTGYLIPVNSILPSERKFSKYLKLESFWDDISKLPARHVLVILDSCRSGFALGQNVIIRRDYEKYEIEMNLRTSRRVISSARHDQSALDSGPIPGHSLFTGALIEALDQSEADHENKGFVTGSELGLWIQKRVSEWALTKEVKQVPDFGSFELDQRGELTIPLLGETKNKRHALESLEAGKAIYKLGWITDDRKRFYSAIRQYRQALQFANLAKLDLLEAELELGKSHFAAGEAEQAVEVLSELVARGHDNTPPEAWLYLGLAHAKQAQYSEAVGNGTHIVPPC